MPKFARIGSITLCAAVLATVGLVGVSVGWAQQPQGAAGSQSGPLVAPTSPPRRPVGADREALRRFVAKRDEARRDKKAARDSEGERRERRASRTRYRDLDSGQARELARSHLKRAFERRRDPVNGPGVSVDAYLGERAVRVKLASGQKAIVESLLPLRSPDASGALAPIDLTVRDAGDAFEPVHASSKLRLPKRLRGGDVELGDSGVRIDIPAPQSDTPGSPEDGGVFYANAEPATDVAVIPEMTGVEVSYLLRSADAPERFVLGYGGMVLREAKEGGVDVLRDGKLVAQVTPPKAWDADGQPVPMRLQADGDQLVIEVDHRDGDFAYPIVADPYTGEDFAYSDGRTSLQDQAGWNRVSTAGSGNPRDTYADPQCTDTGGRFCFGIYSWFYGSGLYTWMRDGHTPGFNNTYNYGDIGEWIYQAPGQSYIYRFDMWQLRNEYDSSCSYQGLFSPGSNRWEEQSYWDPWGGSHSPARVAGDYPPRMSCGTSYTDWLAVCAGQWECRDGEADYGRHIREGGNYAVFGTQIFNTQIPSFTNYLGAANISIGDRDNPQINTLTGPTGWTRDSSAKINTSASDPGLGVRQLKLYAPDQPDWNGTRDSAPACNGDRNSRCSTSRAHTVDVGDLREGRNRILAEATDPVDRRSPPREINVDIDRTPPSAPSDFAGLWDEEGRPRITWAPAPDAVSGTGNYRVRYKRASMTEFTPFTTTYDEEVIISGLTSGEDVAVEVQAVDRAGNVTSSSATVRFDADRAGPTFGSAGLELEGGATTTGYANITWQPADDPDTASGMPGTGVSGYVVRHRTPDGSASGGSWSTPVEVTAPILELQGVTVGESRELEVQSRDWAGNLGAPARSIITLGPYEYCDPNQPTAPACDYPADGEVDEPDSSGDGDVELERDNETDQPNDTNTLRSPANRYMLRSTDPDCADIACYATVRSFAKSWAIGGVRLGHAKNSIRSTVAAVQRENGFYFGSLSALSFRCGWVFAALRSGEPEGTSSRCASSSVQPKFRQFQWTRDPKGNNCFTTKDEQDNYRLRRFSSFQVCNHGTALFMQRSARLCIDVGFSVSDGSTRGCRRSIGTLGAGTCVNWRYLTKHGNFVVVRLSDRKLNRGGWVFIDKNAFSKARLRDFRPNENTGGWPGFYERGTCDNPN